jgi:hypothetical protein
MPEVAPVSHATLPAMEEDTKLLFASVVIVNAPA